MRILKQALNLSFILAALMIMAAAVGSKKAHAETDSIAVVDVQRILNDSKAAKSIQSQLKAHRESFQDELGQREKELREQQQKLSESRAGLSQKQLSAKREEFENKLLETRKLVQKRRRALEQAASESLQQLRKEIVQIVAILAKDNGYEIVITRQNVILAEKELDITEKVMNKLNKDLKKIDLDVETN